ncbi:glycolipid transfer protein-like [Physella acuta]|uniref:glycolipid transfer protein-like n=1 Tax=Physella acuta TaxID=109671 RepID=UPI0027DD42E4|nr:glycolipid transfer protein-like [Physella acuta]
MSGNVELGSGDCRINEFSDKTIFGILSKFQSIDEHETINTVQFLRACSDVTTILDRLGSQFALPKKDMLGNIKRIEDRYLTDPTLYSSLNAIMEKDSKEGHKNSSAIIGIIWLKRGLEFLRAFIKGLSRDYHNKVQEENLRTTVLKAYETTLKPYHGVISKFLFSNLTRFVPYRKDFLKALITDPEGTVETLFIDIDLYLPNFSDNVDLVETLLNLHGLNSQETS